MSEGLSNVVYLTIAVLAFMMGCWKAIAFLRDPTPTLALTVSLQMSGAVVYVMASPVGYQALGEATGQPSFATLPVYIGILACFAMAHILTLLWDPQLRQTPAKLRRTVSAWTGAYTVGAALMMLFFSLAGLSGPADPLRFNTTFAGAPFVLLFLAVFLSTLTSGTLNTWRQCRRVKLEDPEIQHALRAFAFAMLGVFGYVVCAVPAITLASMGNHSLDTVNILGSTFGCVGTLMAYYGLCGAAVAVWWRERSDFKTLQPLWDLVVAGVDEELAYSANSFRSRRSGVHINVTIRLGRRVIEILDGIRTLRPWISSAPAEAVHRLYTNRPATWEPLPGHDLAAAFTAASLREAVARYTASHKEQRPSEPVAPLPGDDTPADKERERLLHVATALSHPIVHAALQDAQNPPVPRRTA